ncbi:hypothetical protein BJ973_004913 [Actinoplanes tereljensis]|uniref:Uncharacterized protein n=1 Tax=Paractinoplanes tereljensis TaxID=571912 RepID=A0A919NNY3_9ACTN|nr:hypothetical protein [Actinoplanes tereljensis]GIF21643.1 hypothetical protein Ate02nite_43730 [Actinoplanes tereljensis]
MTMIAIIFQALSFVGVLIALYFAAMQTRKLQKQVSISNLYSRYEALHHANERYDAGLAMLFQRPDLRSYVFRRKPVDLVGDDLDRALIVADQMAGAVDHALRVGDRFPDEGRGDWSAVAEEMARTPLFQAIVSEKPTDFPDLSRFFPDAQPDEETSDATG